MFGPALPFLRLMLPNTTGFQPALHYSDDTLHLVWVAAPSGRDTGAPGLPFQSSNSQPGMFCSMFFISGRFAAVRNTCSPMVSASHGQGLVQGKPSQVFFFFSTYVSLAGFVCVGIAFLTFEESFPDLGLGWGVCANKHTVIACIYGIV